MEQKNAKCATQLVSELLREVMANACREAPRPDRSRQQLARIARRLRERRRGGEPRRQREGGKEET
jgi:hypothetical protein